MMAVERGRALAGLSGKAGDLPQRLVLDRGQDANMLAAVNGAFRAAYAAAFGHT